MPAPNDNTFWKSRSKSGRGRKFSTPDELWEAATKYFEWVDDNPWHKNEFVKSSYTAGHVIKVPISRPYTLSGLCLFLETDKQTIGNYGTKPGYEDFFDIITRVKDIIYTQKFEGAAVGVFNANIIARDLGLKRGTTCVISNRP